MDKPNSDAFPQWLLEYQQSLHGAEPDEIFTSLKQLSQEEIANRAKEIRRLLRNSGYGLATDTVAWQPDPIPYLMKQEDWRIISSGLIQRMNLLQRIMADLQSEQSLILDGLLAPRLFMSHPAYLPEATKFSPSPKLLAGFDIARQPDGQFKIIRDHFQFPKGLGVLLENRIISRRVMSEEFSELGIERVVHFFNHIQQSLSGTFADNNSPRVVILTEGLDSDDYAEQAYLATFMDLILARSADLTVREGYVWIKSLEGLRKVDVIIRWIPDDLLDSLEQPKYSEVGVPGLFTAIRAGNVVLINGPGTRMLQIPSVHQAIPAIAQHWLQQPLILPQLDILPYQPGQMPLNDEFALKHYTQPQWQADEQTLHNEAPNNLFWQQAEHYDSVAFWSTSGLSSKPFYFRCFAYWDGEQVTVLPASLCTTVDPINGQALGIKDTWIQKVGPQEPTDELTLTVPESGDDIALIEGLIPSRAAENLFWLGTGLERCEYLVRLLRVYIDRFTELAMYPDERHSWSLSALREGIINKRLVYPYTQQPLTENAPKLTSHKQVAWQCMSAKNEPSVLSQALSLVLNSAKQVRELLSYDTFRIIDTLQTLHKSLQSLERNAPLHRLQSLLDSVIAQVMAFNGSIHDSLSLSSGAFMIEMGRRIERSTHLAANFQAMLVNAPVDREQMGALDAVLLTQVSAITHRRRYRIKHNVETCIELLISDAQYPRSLAFQVEQLLSLSEHLPTRKRPGFLSTSTKLLLQLKTQCALAEPAELAKISDDDQRLALATFVNSIQDTLVQFQERLQIRYFSHTQPASKLAWFDVPTLQSKEADREI